MHSTEKSGGLTKDTSFLTKRVWKQFFFSSLILDPLSFIRLHLVLPIAVFGILCFMGTGLVALAAPIPGIQQRGYLTIAVKDNLRPLGFKDASGNLQGLEIDLAKHLAADLLGKAGAVKLQPVSNRDRLSVVLDHQVDLAIARVTATESRERLVSFSVPYYLDSTALITQNTSVQQASDLAKRKIAVLNNSSTIAKLRNFLPTAELIGVSSYAEARERIENQTVAAFAADASVLTGWVQEYPQYRLLADKLSTEPLCIVMPKGLKYDEFRRKVNEAIARYIAEGWLQERIQHWDLI